jgi:hypothetical protein
VALTLPITHSLRKKERAMSTPYPMALAVAERVLKVCTVLNILYGAALVLLLGATLVAPTFISVALVGQQPDASGTLLLGMRLLILVGFVAVPIAHGLLSRLRAMLASVRAGDPFVGVNATRLYGIATAVLGLELLHLVVGMIVRREAFIARGIHIDWSFSFTPWISVLLLFVLAQVFDHGARMREDLDGLV